MPQADALRPMKDFTDLTAVIVPIPFHSIFSRSFGFPPSFLSIRPLCADGRDREEHDVFVLSLTLFLLRTEGERATHARLAQVWLIPEKGCVAEIPRGCVALLCPLPGLGEAELSARVDSPNTL